MLCIFLRIPIHLLFSVSLQYLTIQTGNSSSNPSSKRQRFFFWYYIFQAKSIFLSIHFFLTTIDLIIFYISFFTSSFLFFFPSTIDGSFNCIFQLYKSISIFNNKFIFVSNIVQNYCKQFSVHRFTFGWQNYFYYKRIATSRICKLSLFYDIWRNVLPFLCIEIYFIWLCDVQYLYMTEYVWSSICVWEWCSLIYTNTHYTIS